LIIEVRGNVLTHHIGIWSLRAWGVQVPTGRWRAKYEIWLDNGNGGERDLVSRGHVPAPDDFDAEDTARRRALMRAIAEVVHTMNVVQPGAGSTVLPIPDVTRVS
jgi:hypothetical protein